MFKRNSLQIKRGFTIVELLIVVVVIAILAAITIVAYNGIQQRAQLSGLQSSISQAARKLEVYKLNNGSYPVDIATAQITIGSEYETVYVPAVDSGSFCLSVIRGTSSYMATNNNLTPREGGCVTRNNLVAEWTFNGNANDTSGSGMNGTVSGPTLTTGQNGQANGAYSFSGSSQFISLSTSVPLNFTSQSFTVSSWINLATLPLTSTWYDILSSTSSGGDWSVGINATSAGVGRIMMTKINQADAPAGPTIAQNVWKHVVTSYTYGAGPIGTVRYYVDGELGSTVTWNHAGSGNFAPNVKRIGSRATNGFFRGSIDDLRVYDRVLSDNEVRSMYAAGAQ